MPDPRCAPTVAPGWTPDWVFCPREKILSVVVEWIVAGFVAVGDAITGSVEEVFASLGVAGTTAGEGVVFSFTNVAQAFLGVAFAVNNAILDVAATAGPAAPVVAFVLFAVAVFALLASLRLLVRLYTVVRTWIV